MSVSYNLVLIYINFICFKIVLRVNKSFLTFQQRDMDFRNRLEVLTSRTSGKVRNVTCVMQELGYLDQVSLFIFYHIHNYAYYMKI